MATTRLYLDLRGKAKDDKGSVVINLSHNGGTASISTGIRISRNEWRDGKIIKTSDQANLNAVLLNKKSDIDRKLAILSLDERFPEMSATEVRRRIVGGKIVKERRHKIADLFAEYVGNGNLKSGTKEIYSLALKKVLDYGGVNAVIEDVNLKWLRGFDRYLAKTQGVNGRSIYLRSLRAVCNYALHTRVISSYPFSNFQIKQEPTKKRSVSVELFRKFIEFPTTKKNEVFRDYFLLMFYLIGVNTKDLLLARKEAVAKGRFEYIREKTHKKYSIKIEPEAEELLQRYEGKDWLLEAMDHCVHYKSFAHEINDALKEIGEQKEETIPNPDDLFAEPTVVKTITPVIPGITTYYARHCWATFAYEAGISVDVISQAMGHSFGNRTTLIYIKPDQSKVDKANRRVIDYVQGKVTRVE